MKSIEDLLVGLENLQYYTVKNVRKKRELEAFKKSLIVSQIS